MPLSSLQETVHPYLTKQSFYPLNPFQVKGAENPVLKVCAVAAVKEKGRREGALMREGGHEARHLESARLFQRKIIPLHLFPFFEKRCKKMQKGSLSYLNEQHREGVLFSFDKDL